jgi:hypothetical protein
VYVRNTNEQGWIKTETPKQVEIAHDVDIYVTESCSVHGHVIRGTCTLEVQLRQFSMVTN